MFQKVAESSALQQNGDRVHVSVEGRFVTVLRHKEKLFCIDSTCYHTGGPLGNGDIEEVQGEACIVCPWHMYQITLEDGAKLYESLVVGANNKLVPGGWKKKQHAQRVHEVERRPDGIYVKLNQTGVFDSDHYGMSAMCGTKIQGTGQKKESKIHSRSPFSGALPQRSGHVLNPSAAVPSNSSSPSIPFAAPLLGPSTNLKALSAEQDEDLEDEFLEEEEEGLVSQTPQWFPFKVEAVEMQGAAGVNLTLGLRTSDEDPRVVLKAIVGETPFEDGGDSSLASVLNTYHVDLALEIGGEFTKRPFTPVQSSHRLWTGFQEIGTLQLDMVIRLYPEGELGPKLAQCKVGDVVHVGCGTGEKEHGKSTLSQKPAAPIEEIYLFAGGSGITPILQVLQNVVDRQSMLPSLKVVYCIVANKSLSTSLGLDVLDRISRDASALVQVIHLLSSTDATFPHVGKVLSATRVDDVAFLTSIGVGRSSHQVFLWCGPQGFNDSIGACLGSSFGVDESSCIEFFG